MKNMLRRLADLTAVVGALLCALAGLARVAGYYALGGMDAITLFNGGVGLMVFSLVIWLRFPSGE